MEGGQRVERKREVRGTTATGTVEGRELRDLVYGLYWAERNNRFKLTAQNISKKTWKKGRYDLHIISVLVCLYELSHSPILLYIILVFLRMFFLSTKAVRNLLIGESYGKWRRQMIQLVFRV
jgi:hypothetical protein